jgi:hypothetical protein
VCSGSLAEMVSDRSGRVGDVARCRMTSHRVQSTPRLSRVYTVGMQLRCGSALRALLPVEDVPIWQAFDPFDLVKATSVAFQYDT